MSLLGRLLRQASERQLPTMQQLVASVVAVSKLKTEAFIKESPNVIEAIKKSLAQKVRRYHNLSPMAKYTMPLERLKCALQCTFVPKLFINANERTLIIS